MSDLFSRVDPAIREKLKQPGLRVRLNNETYIKFNGTDQLIFQNAYCESALSIQFDILLIIYEITDWRSVQELIAPWPEADQDKILNYLAMFYQSQMLLIEGMESAAQNQGKESDSPQAAPINKVPINVENHHNMLKDNVRMAAYRRAIERVIKPDSVVMDLGCGSGVLSFFSSLAGAKHIYAIEKHPHILLMAKELAKANKITNIDFIEGTSNLIQPSQFKDQPDILVSEIIGDGILEENILEYTLDVRDRLLKPGAKLVPWKLDVFGFAFYGDSVKQQQLQEVKEFNDLYGLDFGLIGQILASKATLRRERYHHQLYKAKSEPILLKSLDLTTLKDSNFSQTIEFPITQEGSVSGLCLYFKAWLDESTILTNSPWAPSTHWTHLLYNFAEPLELTTDDSLKATLIYDGALRVSLL